MIKYFAVFSLCCLLFACDPVYRLRYCVRNQTTDTVYVKFKNYPDSINVVYPDSLLVLQTKQGVGYAKEKYKAETFQTWFKENALLIKKQKDNSLKKISESTWKYEGSRIHEGSAILDVNK